jgi:Zn-dependent protease
MSTSGRPNTDQQRLWRRLPNSYRAGIIVATISPFVSIAVTSKKTINGVVTACSYLDIAKLGVAAVLVVLAVIGLIANRRSAHPLPGWVAALLPVAFIAVAAYLAAKGVGWRSDYCQSAD